MFAQYPDNQGYKDFLASTNWKTDSQNAREAFYDASMQAYATHSQGFTASGALTSANQVAFVDQVATGQLNAISAAKALDSATGI